MSRPTMPNLAHDLLRYSLANPGASDSADGIARWWLDPSAGVDMQALDEALQFLVARGAYAERQAADGRRRYRRVGSDAAMQALLAQVAAMLAGGPRPPPAGGPLP